jgi:hypothetical protein
VVLYTGYSEEVSDELVSQLGIRALVNKPVDAARLHDLVRDLLAGAAER